MSLVLERSNGITCKTLPGVGGGFQRGIITIGGLEVDAEDFCDLVIYFLTNTDLQHHDVRQYLMLRIAELDLIPGYNPGGTRLGKST